jgi:serine protease Do
MKILIAGLTGLLFISAVRSPAVRAERSMQPTPLLMARSIEEKTANQVYHQANAAVVLIRSGDRAHGSGFIVSADGLVITNAHVAANAPSVVTLVMADGKTELPADVVGFAKDGVDLAVLKINGRRQLPFLRLGDGRSMRVGDQVFAIGTPLTENNLNTLTNGIVSALRADSLVQHSAAINSGNSGGPLLNGAGELVGVNTAVAVVPVICRGGQYCGQSLGNVGIGYAIGVDVVKEFLSNIERGNISPVSTLPE